MRKTILCLVKHRQFCYPTYTAPSTPQPVPPTWPYLLSPQGGFCFSFNLIRRKCAIWLMPVEHASILLNIIAKSCMTPAIDKNMPLGRQQNCTNSLRYNAMWFVCLSSAMDKFISYLIRGSTYKDWVYWKLWMRNINVPRCRYKWRGQLIAFM